MHGNDPVQGEASLTWKQWVTLSLVACVFSAALGAWRPIWIAPPYFRFTAFLYLVLAWSGTALLLIARRYRPTGGRALPMLGALVNVVASLLISIVIVSMFLFGPSECDVVTTGTIFLHYNCSWSFFYQGYGLHLYGLPYLPLMIGIGTGSSVGSSFG